MRKLLLALPVIVVGCASSPQQALLNACDAHDRSVRALSGFAATGALTQRQVDAVDTSIAVADTVCDGTVTDYRSALNVLEAEVLRLAIVQSTAGE